MGYDKYDEEGKVVCQECGQSFNLLAHAHMKRKHSMTINEYKDKYPEFPISSDRFKTSQKFRTVDAFKKEEEPKPLSKEELDLLDKEDLKKIKPEELVDFKEDEDKEPEYIKPDTNTPLNKVQVAAYLKSIFPNLIVNFDIKKYTLSGHLEYMYATDMVDVATRIIFDFPNCYWHTGEHRPSTRKEYHLTTDGWKIIKILQQHPTINDIKNILDIIDE